MSSPSPAPEASEAGERSAVTSAMERAPQAGSWTWRRILFGDWTWLIRDPLDVLRFAFIGGTVVFAIQGRSTAAAVTAASAVLLIAWAVDLPRWFDFAVTVAMTAIAWGTALDLYGEWFYYDKVVHGVSPIGYAPVLYIALVRLGVVPDPGDAIRERRVARISGIFIITVAIGMAVGAGYESVEWIEDKFNLLGGHFVKGLWDTETDLLCDTAGSLTAGILLTVWSLRGWTSRRVPGTSASWSGPTALSAVLDWFRRLGSATAPTWRNRIEHIPPAGKGIVGIAGGTLLLVWPNPTLRAVGVVFAVVLILHAAFDLLDVLHHGIRGGAGRLAALVVELGTAALVLTWPGMSQTVLIYALGGSSVIFACVEVASLTVNNRSNRERWLGGAAAVAALVFGVALLGRPELSFDAVVTALGLYLGLTGVLGLLRAVDPAIRTRSTISGK